MTTKKTKAKKPAVCPPEFDGVMLRQCAADMTSQDGQFVWPREGLVTAPDWSPRAECGNGLHGWLNGEGDADSSPLKGRAVDSVWLVARVVSGEVVDLGGKVKVPRAWVTLAGTREEAADEVARLCPGRLVIGLTATAGDAGTATAGYAGTATAGDAGTATAGARGTATAGDEGTATAGDAGTATAGARGTATAGARGTATAGARGTATAGDAGTATAGDEGEIRIRYWAGTRYRTVIGYIGEDGLEAGVAYVVHDGRLVRKAVAS